MLVAYFGRLAPLIQDEFDGEVAEFVGDQIFAVFNKARRPAGSRSAGRRRRTRAPARRRRDRGGAPGLADLPRRHQHRRGARRCRRRARPPHPRRLRRHGQPRRPARGPGAARRSGDRRRDVRAASTRRRRRGAARAAGEGQVGAGRPPTSCARFPEGQRVHGSQARPGAKRSTPGSSRRWRPSGWTRYTRNVNWASAPV